MLRQPLRHGRLRVYRQAAQEESVVFVEVKNGRRRAVFFHGVQNLGDSGGAALGHIQFLEKLADAAVAVPAGERPAGT